MEIVCGKKPYERSYRFGVAHLAEIACGPGAILGISESRDERPDITIAICLPNPSLSRDGITGGRASSANTTQASPDLAVARAPTGTPPVSPYQQRHGRSDDEQNRTRCA